MGAVVPLQRHGAKQHHWYETCNMEDNAKSGFRLIFKSVKGATWYKDLAKKAVWFHLILEVAHEPRQVAFGGTRIALERGQMVTSAASLSDACGVSEDQARRALDYFEQDGAITRTTKRGAHGYTIVTLRNFDAYQRGFNRSFSADLESGNVADLECHRNSMNNKEKHPLQDGASADSDADISADYHADYLAEDSNTEINKSIRAKNNSSNEELPHQPAKKRAVQADCQAMVDAYHRLLPGMPAIRELTATRKTKLKNFWSRFKFTDERWEAYLGYIAENCRWMSERRQRADGESQWKPKNLDFLITEKCYLGVREGRFDD